MSLILPRPKFLTISEILLHIALIPLVGEVKAEAVRVVAREEAKAEISLPVRSILLSECTNNLYLIMKRLVDRALIGNFQDTLPLIF